MQKVESARQLLIRSMAFTPSVAMRRFNLSVDLPATTITEYAAFRALLIDPIGPERKAA